MTKMQHTKTSPVEGAVTPAEAARFAAVADEVITSPKYRAAGRKKGPSPEGAPHIGTLREKRLHAAIKLYLCPDETCHERPVADMLAADTADTPGAADVKTRMVADILTDGHILEVQTGGFFSEKNN